MRGSPNYGCEEEYCPEYMKPIAVTAPDVKTVATLCKVVVAVDVKLTPDDIDAAIGKKPLHLYHLKLTIFIFTYDLGYDTCWHITDFFSIMLHVMFYFCSNIIYCC